MFLHFGNSRLYRLREALLLALVLVDLQNTCAKKLNRKMLESPNICYVFEKLRVRGCVCMYDIQMCQYHSTRPQPIQLVPTMQKMHFTLSFQPKFLKIWFTKLLQQALKVRYT